MKLLFQFQADGPRPTLESVIQDFGFQPGEVDQDYGVVQVDTRTYVVRVDEGARTRLPERPGTAFFGEPGIQAFGSLDSGE